SERTLGRTSERTALDLAPHRLCRDATLWWMELVRRCEFILGNLGCPCPCWDQRLLEHLAFLGYRYRGVLSHLRSDRGAFCPMVSIWCFQPQFSVPRSGVENPSPLGVESGGKGPKSDA